MMLTVLIAVLAACGIFSILWLLTDALTVPLPEQDAYYIVRLRGDASTAAQTVRSCLRLQKRGLRGRLIFVDCGLCAEGQTAVELLIRREAQAVLCAPSQVCEMIHWEYDEFGARAD